MGGVAEASSGQHGGAWRGPFDPGAAFQRRQALFGGGLAGGGEEAGDVGEDGVGLAAGGEGGEEGVGDLADLAAADDDGQDRFQRRAAVAAGAQAVVAAEHDQARAGADAVDQGLHGGGLEERAIEVADQDDVEAVEGGRVGGNAVELEVGDIGALLEDVGAGLDAGRRIRGRGRVKGSAGRGAVFRAEGAFEVEDADLGLDDLGDGCAAELLRAILSSGSSGMRTV